MKTKILLLLMVIPFFGYTQGDLQFSQVKLVSAIETVPVGMVWKVTKVLPSTAAGGQEQAIDIKVNGIAVRLKAATYANSVGVTTWSTLDGTFWLPAGTTLAVDRNCVYISVIEFSTQ